MNEINIWDECLRAFDDVLTDKDMKTWFLPLEVKQNSSTLRVIAPNRFIRDQIESEYLTLIKETVALKSSNSITEVMLMLPGSPKTTPRKSWNDRLRNNINNDLTFENFVEGKSNQLAKAACVSVVSEMGQYNPLYIYGGVGLGKTHLLNAIGLSLQNNNNVMFISAERFMYHFIKSIKKNDMVNFKDFFRKSSVFIIDDIQFISGKESLQEEFFHTFNSLMDKGSQIIISSDRAPMKLDRVQDRIKSRLSGGLVVDIEIPDLELKSKIIKKKIEEIENQFKEKISLSDEVINFIASESKTNIRELIGILNRVIAFSRVHNKNLNINDCKNILKDVFNQIRVITVDKIQNTVSNFFNISLSDMLSQRRSRPLARPRQIAMYLAKKLTTRSLPEIGRRFANRDHTTVIHAVKTITRLEEQDDEMKKNINQIKSILVEQ